jgi:hypothetical protein
MSANTLLTLSAGVLLGATIAAPNPALAQFGPLPGPPPMLAGPPPGPAIGGPPRGGPLNGPGLPPRGGASAPPREITGGPPRLDGAGGLHGLERGGQADFRAVESRATYSANSFTRNGYASYGDGRRSRRLPYAAAAAAYTYGGSDASSEDGCYYVSTHRRDGTRDILVCHEN